MKIISIRALTQTAAAAALSLAALLPASQAQAQDAILGEVKLFGFNFCPRGYAAAAGQLLPIAQNSALFSLYGTIYGGDGRTTFALPDLRGRVPVSQGQAPGFSNYAIGQKGGLEGVTLTPAELASHNHALMATNTVADQKKPNGDTIAFPDIAVNGSPLKIYSNAAPDAPMNAGSIGNTGGGLPHENRMPYQVMNWCVATQGIFPSRN